MLNDKLYDLYICSYNWHYKIALTSMIIVDKDIKELLISSEIIITSLDPNYPFDLNTQVGSGSIDLRLGTVCKKYKSNLDIIDLSYTEKDLILEETAPDNDIYILPNEIILATSLEFIYLPSNIAGFLTGRSSIARLGLMVQCCQDFIQPGHQAAVPLQLVNITSKPIKIKTHLKICQLVLLKTTTASEKPYFSIKDAKYKNESLYPRPSKIGIETGDNDIDDFTTIEKGNKNLEKEINKLRSKIIQKENNTESEKLKSSLSNAIFIVLGASVGVIIPEMRATNFPTNIFFTAASLIIFSIVLLIIIRQKNK